MKELNSEINSEIQNLSVNTEKKTIKISQDIKNQRIKNDIFIESADENVNPNFIKFETNPYFPENESVILNQKNCKMICSNQYINLSPDSFTFTKVRKQELLLKIPNGKIFYFQSLFVLLNKYLLNEKINNEDILPLGDTETKIMKWFIYKKGLTNEKIKNKDITVEHLNQIRPFSKKKNEEEKLKYVLLNSINFLKKLWIIKQTKNSSKIKVLKLFKSASLKYQLEIAFYMHYFGRAAEQANIPLTYFFHPQKSFEKCKNLLPFSELLNREKTITLEYIKRLKLSHIFMGHFLGFLDGSLHFHDGKKIGFLKIVRHNIQAKLKHKILKWEQMLESEGLESIRKDLLENVKCKLPWFYLSVLDAINHTMAKFE